nr:MAG TPA: Preneck appendage protein helix, VIRAL PROTEIN.05A [Caudoviricetes sp.]
MFNTRWPYSNFHELNLDWILETLKKQNAAIADFISLNSITYADPLQWDITRQYPKNQVVLDTNGDGYLSVQPVPVGVEIDNTDYWTKIGNFSELWSTVKLAITAADEGLKTTASADRASGDLVWLNNTLYVCTTAITRGTEYGTNNTAKTTIDARLANLAQAVSTMQSNIADINTALPNKIDKDTTGDLAQTVSGKYGIHADTFTVTSNDAAGDRAALKIYSNSNTPVDIGSDGGTWLHGLTRTQQIIQKYNDNFDWWPLADSRGNVRKVAVIREDANFTTIPHSPVDIRTYQALKMDGTDDITATINTHTKTEPLFIPAGTYKISAPLQLKHSLYGASASRDPARGSSDTILQYTGNPTAFGSLGVLTVSGNDVDGNVVIANLDIICNGMIGGIVYTTDVYTDNYIANVSISGVKSYGVYLQPNNSKLSRYCYMDNVTVWGFSDVHPAERVSGNVAFYWGDKSPDCDCNNLLAMVCQTGFDCRTNVFGCNWITYNGIPAGGTGGTDADSWWENTNGLKVTNNDVHITNLYLDTCRRGIVFDGPGKAAAYINNLIYTVDDNTATTGEGDAAIALIGTSPSPQLTVDGGVINRSAKVSTTVQTIGQYPVTAMMCKINNAYIYTKREYIFSGNSQYICKSGEHRCIDLAITDQMQYTIAGQVVTGNPVQYKAFAYIPLSTADTPPAQGSIRVRDQDDIDITVYLSVNSYTPNDFICAVVNRDLYKAIAAASGGTKSISYTVDTSGQNKIYYAKDNNALVLYAARPAGYSYTVTCEGFNTGLSPVILDRIRNMDGTPMDFPRWSDASGLTPIKVLIPTIS